MNRAERDIGDGSSQTVPLQTIWDSVLLTLDAPQPKSTVEPNQPIPVTVFAGFLGAGKTTLLCHLLESTSLSIVAIVNDLAAVNLDSEKVRSTSAETIELENGCACCVLGGDLNQALASIGQRDRRPDAVVIEASGVSDPTGIAQTVGGVDGVVLDGIVTLVDGRFWSTQAANPRTAVLFDRQLAAAHLVAVSQCELSDESYRELGDRVPGRALIRFEQLYQNNPAELLLGVVYRSARLPIAAAEHDTGHYTSSVISFQHSLDAEALVVWLEQLPVGVYRVKGSLLVCDNGVLKHVEVQAVGRRWRLSDLNESEQSATLVVIGASDDASVREHIARLQALETKRVLTQGTQHAHS